MSCFDKKGLEEECVGPPYWSVERPGGDLQDAVAADCKTVNSSHFSRYRNRRRNLSVPVAPIWLRHRGWAILRLISSQKDIFVSEVNGFGKDK
jgi:hypothetical protein